jgi:protein O-GlcNAc transferase
VCHLRTFGGSRASIGLPEGKKKASALAGLLVLVALTRSELGLPDAGFVFCSFNNNNKINPSTFDSWMRILLRVNGSVLWLFESNAAAARNLRREAECRGVDPGRLVFARFAPIEQHLNRIQYADLFLDTYPCNAHTTASDALRMGLPLLTRIGTTFAGRVAASLLRALDLGELIVDTVDGYERLAIELATNRARLLSIRERLQKNVSTSTLYDARLFARRIERAYEMMVERRRSGLPPDVIEVID